MGLSAAGQPCASEPPPANLAERGDSNVAEIDIKLLPPANAGGLLPIDKRQAELGRKILIDAAVASSSVDQGRNRP